MAVLILVADERGNVIRVERREDRDFREQLLTTYRAGEIATAGTTFHAIADQNIYLFNDVFNAIKNSPKLSDEERAKAFELYNSFAPGDRISTVVERGVIQVFGDQSVNPKPLIAVFIDP